MNPIPFPFGPGLHGGDRSEAVPYCVLTAFNAGLREGDQSRATLVILPKIGRALCWALNITHGNEHFSWRLENEALLKASPNLSAQTPALCVDS